MQRKRGELVPIGEVVSGLDDVPEIRDNSPQARHHFTKADQVHQLVTASEADADLGFMARLMALCSLPRTNPGALSTASHDLPLSGLAGLAAAACILRSYQGQNGNPG